MTLVPMHDFNLEGFLRGYNIPEQLVADNVPPGALHMTLFKTKNRTTKIIRLNPKCYIDRVIFKKWQKITVLSGKVVIRPKRGLELNLSRGESHKETFPYEGKIISHSNKNTFLIVRGSDE
jgi:hypothetical protein